MIFFRSNSKQHKSTKGDYLMKRFLGVLVASMFLASAAYAADVKDEKSKSEKSEKGEKSKGEKSKSEKGETTKSEKSKEEKRSKSSIHVRREQGGPPRLAQESASQVVRVFGNSKYQPGFPIGSPTRSSQG